MVTDFQKENPNIKIKPIYAGSYQTRSPRPDRAEGRHAASCAIDRHVHADRRRRHRADRLLAKSDADKKWLGGFYDAFMQNSARHAWGVLFQRSTIVMYYNKDLFAAGLIRSARPPPGQSWSTARS